MTPDKIKALRELHERGDTRIAWEALPKLLDEIEKLKAGYLADENGNEYVAVTILKEKIREQAQEIETWTSLAVINGKSALQFSRQLAEAKKVLEAYAGHSGADWGLRDDGKLAREFLEKCE